MRQRTWSPCRIGTRRRGRPRTASDRPARACSHRGRRSRVPTSPDGQAAVRSASAQTRPWCDEKAYVEQCRAGGTTPSATAPEPKPTAAAPPPSRPAPTATEAAPAPAPQRQAPTTTAAPAPAPAQQPSARSDTATLEAGQFADEGSAKARCPSDTVVWVNLPSKIYHFAGTRSYGTTKRGAYMCEKEAIAAEDRASKTEKHP